MPKFESLISNIIDWNFPIFEFNEVTNGRPLFFVGQALFSKYQFLEKFHIPREKLDNFLNTIENGYHKLNPYHNNIHATDVAISFNYLLIQSELINNILFNF